MKIYQLVWVECRMPVLLSRRIGAFVGFFIFFFTFLRLFNSFYFERTSQKSGYQGEGGDVWNQARDLQRA
jgi:hypothetical protein